MDRRTFLRGAGLTAAAAGASGLLAACGLATPAAGRGGAARTSAPPSPPTTVTGPPPTSPAGGAPDWAALAGELEGPLIRPQSPRYAAASELFDTRFDAVRPQAVAACRSPDDVARCIGFARGAGLPLAVRSGGHSYAGYSTGRGLVVDVGGLNEVRVDRAAGTATVGAGTRLIDMYAHLARHESLVPGGSCPTVGIAGLALGGGIGVLGRAYGLTCDNVAALRIVTADGRTLDCDETSNADLFWACRGGGGGNFGVVTAFTFRVHPVPASLSLLTVDWPWSAAADVAAAWTEWIRAAPDELWSNCLLTAGPGGPAGAPVARTTGVLLGTTARAAALLRRLIALAGTAPSGRFVGAAPYLDAMLVEAGCEGMRIDQCRLPSQGPGGLLRRGTFAARSDFVTGSLPAGGASALVAAVARRQADPRLAGGGIALDAWGGAVNRVRPEATAFVHRDAVASIQYSAEWTPGARRGTVRANERWLADAWTAMRPFVSGQAYQNYIDPDLPDWLSAYYGANLPRLRAVKARYDPDDVFHFAQGIPPA